MASERRLDAAWEVFGRIDPYFGVLSADRFRAANRESPARQEFFRTGEEHIEQVLAMVREDVDPSFVPRRALDFGCGVGRVAIPLARVADTVVGVDVSPSMLAEARRNLSSAGIANVTLAESDDRLSRVEGSFDFIHSYIVFQHISPRRGEGIFRGLIERLTPGGVGAIHVTHAIRVPTPRRIVQRARRSVPFLHELVNVLQGRSPSYPLMAMNAYDVTRLLIALEEGGCHGVRIRFTSHGDWGGMMMLFRKETTPAL